MTRRNWREAYKLNCELAETVYRLERDPLLADYHDILTLLEAVKRGGNNSREKAHKRKCQKCDNTFYVFGLQVNRITCLQDACRNKIRKDRMIEGQIKYLHSIR